MKLGFVSCVRLGLSCMQAIYDSGYTLQRIFTLRDNIARNKSGRVFFDEFAAVHDIPLTKLRNVNEPDAVEMYRELDWLFIVGWSQIASREVIDGPKNGVLGIHPTLLPAGRGRAAIPWAILKNLRKTGVTLFRLDEGVDTGPILAQLEIPLGSSTTATQLYDHVAQAHVDLIRQTLPHMSAGSVLLREQDETAASEWPGRKPEDGLINLDGSVVDAERLIRAVTRPYPGAFYYNESGEKIIVWSARHVDENSGKGNYLQFPDGMLLLEDIDVQP